jgi:hypothetical protein
MYKKLPTCVVKLQSLLWKSVLSLMTPGTSKAAKSSKLMIPSPFELRDECCELGHSFTIVGLSQEASNLQRQNRIKYLFLSFSTILE